MQYLKYFLILAINDRKKCLIRKVMIVVKFESEIWGESGLILGL